jgi:PKD repeat protein
LYWIETKDLNNCNAIDSVNVNFDSQPVVDLGLDELFCYNGSRPIDAGNSGNKFAWYNQSGLLDTSQIIIAKDTGTYWVIVSTPYGCSNSDTIQMIAPADRLIAEFLSASNVEVGDSIQFVELASPYKQNMTYFWSFGNGDTSVSANPIYSYTKDGSYQVMLIVKNTTCIDTIIKPVLVKPKRKYPQQGVLAKIPEFKIINLSAYPNPTSDGLLNVLLEMNAPKEVDIYFSDLQNRTIVHEKLIASKNNQYHYDLSSVKAGVYIIRVESENSVKYFRFVRN